MFKTTTRAAALAAAGLFGMLSVDAPAQDLQRSTAIASSDVLSQISMFNFREGRRASDLILRPTPVVRTGDGAVRVRFRNDNAEISASVRRLPEPATLGPYTVYLLWALTPDGRASNKGVLVGASGGRGEIDTQHSGSQFALIVTAEPHFAVSAPSTMVVLYNVADSVRAEESRVTSLTEQADYSRLAPIAGQSDTPVEVIQAGYAVAISRAVGAEQYAPALHARAKDKLAAAEEAAGANRRRERQEAPGLAREAVIAGEDARRAALIARAEAEAEAGRQAAAAAAAAEASRAAEAAAAEAARVAAAAAEAGAAEAARADLRNRLDSVLPTRESARGLVSEVGGVQFATGTADLSSPARESLARFSGIVASYPDLTFVIEGHTDSIGSDATNNELSRQRAISVRDYLIGQGIAASRIDVRGYGSSRPVADNSSAGGRARNRRVEIVISGGLLTARR